MEEAEIKQKFKHFTAIVQPIKSCKTARAMFIIISLLFNLLVTSKKFKFKEKLNKS